MSALQKLRRIFTGHRPPATLPVEEEAALADEIQFNRKVLDMTIARAKLTNKVVRRQAVRDMDRAAGLIESATETVRVLQRSWG